LTDVIDNGVTANGKPYALNAKYYDAFHASNDNSAESVFAIQASIKDGSGGSNSNYDLNLNFPYNVSPFCCGFFQPSMDLANLTEQMAVVFRYWMEATMTQETRLAT